MALSLSDSQLGGEQQNKQIAITTINLQLRNGSKNNNTKKQGKLSVIFPLPFELLEIKITKKKKNK